MLLQRTRAVALQCSRTIQGEGLQLFSASRSETHALEAGPGAPVLGLAAPFASAAGSGYAERKGRRSDAGGPQGSREASPGDPSDEFRRRRFPVPPKSFGDDDGGYGARGGGFGAGRGGKGGGGGGRGGGRGGFGRFRPSAGQREAMDSTLRKEDYDTARKHTTWARSGALKGREARDIQAKGGLVKDKPDAVAPTHGGAVGAAMHGRRRAIERAVEESGGGTRGRRGRDEAAAARREVASRLSQLQVMGKEGRLLEAGEAARQLVAALAARQGEAAKVLHAYAQAVEERDQQARAEAGDEDGGEGVRARGGTVRRRMGSDGGQIGIFRAEEDDSEAAAAAGTGRGRGRERGRRADASLDVDGDVDMAALEDAMASPTGLLSDVLSKVSPEERPSSLGNGESEKGTLLGVYSRFTHTYPTDLILPIIDAP